MMSMRLRFKTCRLLSGNVRNRELTIIQRRILRRLRNKKRSIKRKIYPRENLNSYIQSLWTKERQLLLMEFLSNSIPVLISFCFVSLGVPLVCFCDPEDGGDGAGPQEEGPSASAAGPSSRVEGLNRFPDTRKRGRELVGEDFSPSDSDSDRPDPEAPPSGNAQSEPYTFHFGERRLPDLNEEAPTLHEDPSHEEIRQCIEEEASVSESELPPTNDEVPEDLRSLLLGKRKLPDLNEALSGESEKEKEALVSRIREKASEYLRIRGERASNVLRKLQNRGTFAQCEKFLRQIPDFLSDKEKAPEESDVDYDE